MITRSERGREFKPYQTQVAHSSGSRLRDLEVAKGYAKRNQQQEEPVTVTIGTSRESTRYSPYSLTHFTDDCGSSGIQVRDNTRDQGTKEPNSYQLSAQTSKARDLEGTC